MANEIAKGVCSHCGQVEDAYNREFLGWVMLGHTVKTKIGVDSNVTCLGSGLAPQTMNIKTE